eukprot:Amastigsp_a179450_10.p2 type:complete len:100 gc:universal Amastigsp_a179450_10:226-525(+)
MFANNARVVPDIARACCVSAVALTNNSSPSRATEIPETSDWLNLPRGPLTETSDAEITTSTLAGIAIGFLATRDILILLRPRCTGLHHRYRQLVLYDQS